MEVLLLQLAAMLHSARQKSGDRGPCFRVVPQARKAVQAPPEAATSTCASYVDAATREQWTQLLPAAARTATEGATTRGDFLREAFLAGA